MRVIMKKGEINTQITINMQSMIAQGLLKILHGQETHIEHMHISYHHFASYPNQDTKLSLL